MLYDYPLHNESVMKQSKYVKSLTKQSDKLAVTGLEGYINIYVYFTVIGGPRVHHSLMWSSIY